MNDSRTNSERLAACANTLARQLKKLMLAERFDVRDAFNTRRAAAPQDAVDIAVVSKEQRPRAQWKQQQNASRQHAI